MKTSKRTRPALRRRPITFGHSTPRGSPPARRSSRMRTASLRRPALYTMTMRTAVPSATAAVPTATRAAVPAERVAVLLTATAVPAAAVPVAARAAIPVAAPIETHLKPVETRATRAKIPVAAPMETRPEPAMAKVPTAKPVPKVLPLRSPRKPSPTTRWWISSPTD